MKYLKKIITKIIKTIFLILIIGIAILNTVYSLQKNWKSTYMLKIGNILFYQDNTTAMEPNIKKQDLMIIKLQKKYEINDVIVFIQNDETKIRRITSNSGNNIEDSYIVKGDNNFYNEPYEVHKIQVMGKVTKTFRGLAFVLKLIESKFLLILNTALLSIMVYYRIKIKIRINKKRKTIKT